jgi:hypothetical protein
MRMGRWLVEISSISLDLVSLVNLTQPSIPSFSLLDAEGSVPKPDGPAQVEPREEPCVWEQRHTEEREIPVDTDTGDGC